MKKAFIIVLAIWTAACILGCSSPEAIPTEPAPFEVVYRDIPIHIQDPAAPVLEALGEPKAYTEETSCVFEGLDKTYYFGSLYLLTRPDPEGDKIQSIWFADDTIATSEGITIGATQDAVEAAYGPDCLWNAKSCTITRADSTLTIILSDGVVSGVRYDAALTGEE